MTGFSTTGLADGDLLDRRDRGVGSSGLLRRWRAASGPDRSCFSTARTSKLRISLSWSRTSLRFASRTISSTWVWNSDAMRRAFLIMPVTRADRHRHVLRPDRDQRDDGDHGQSRTRQNQTSCGLAVSRSVSEASGRRTPARLRSVLVRSAGRVRLAAVHRPRRERLQQQILAPRQVAQVVQAELGQERRRGAPERRPARRFLAALRARSARPPAARRASAGPGWCRGSPRSPAA